MPELYICPECGAHNHFKQESLKERKCCWWNCGHVFTLADKLKGLKATARKTNKKLAIEADIKVRTFEGLISGRFTPSKDSSEKLDVLFKRYFSDTKNDFVAEG